MFNKIAAQEPFLNLYRKFESSSILCSAITLTNTIQHSAHSLIRWILYRGVIGMKLTTTSKYQLSLPYSAKSSISVHVPIYAQLTYRPHAAFLGRKLPPCVMMAPSLMWRVWHAPLLTCSSVISADITLFYSGVIDWDDQLVCQTSRMP